MGVEYRGVSTMFVPISQVVVRAVDALIILRPIRTEPFRLQNSGGIITCLCDLLIASGII